jgi:hypothetical protein
MPIFSPKYFGENILKIITSVPVLFSMQKSSSILFGRIRAPRVGKKVEESKLPLEAGLRSFCLDAKKPSLSLSLSLSLSRSLSLSFSFSLSLLLLLSLSPSLSLSLSLSLLLLLFFGLQKSLARQELFLLSLSRSRERERELI